MEIDLPKVFNYLEAENWQASNTFSEMSEHLRRSKIKENSPMDKELDYISHNYSKLKNAFNISKKQIKDAPDKAFDNRLFIHMIYTVGSEKNVKKIANYYEITGHPKMFGKLTFEGMKFYESEHYDVYMGQNKPLKSAKALVKFTILENRKNAIAEMKNEEQRKIRLEKEAKQKYIDDRIQLVKDLRVKFNQSKSLGEAIDQCQFLKNKDYKFYDNGSYDLIVLTAQFDLSEINKELIESIMENNKVSPEKINKNIYQFLDDKFFAIVYDMINGGKSPKRPHFSFSITEKTQEYLNNYYNGVASFTKNYINDECNFVNKQKFCIKFSFEIDKKRNKNELIFKEFHTQSVYDYDDFGKNKIFYSIPGLSYNGNKKEFLPDRDVVVELINDIYNNTPISYAKAICAELFLNYCYSYNYRMEQKEKDKNAMF